MQRQDGGLGAIVAVLAMIALGGCADLPQVDAGECGNLVLDVDEDCDGFSAFTTGGTTCGDPGATNACFYVCDLAETRCPDGWACGQDGRCRRYSGEYATAEGSPYPFEVIDFTAVDLDGDGQTDLIGTDRLALYTLFGDDGELTPGARFATSPQRGPIGYGEINGDESTDLAIPISGGVSVFVGNDGDLDPLIYSPIALDAFIGPNDALQILAVESTIPPFSPGTEMILAVDTYDVNQVYQGSFMGFFDQPGVGLPGGFKVSDLAGRVASAYLQGPDDTRQEFAMAFTGASSVWVYTSSGGLNMTPLTINAPTQIDLPAGATVDQGAAFAEVDGRNGPDLLISMTDSGGVPRVAVAFNDGTGLLGVPFVHPMFERGGFGHPWPLAFGELGNDERADYVYPEGVYLSERTTPGPGFPEVLWFIQPATTTIWDSATIGDFNGDGTLDVAAASTQVDGVDIFINDPTSLYFNHYSVDTPDPPSSLRKGDFNGDLNDDVAYVRSGMGDAEDHVEVIFGSSDGPADSPADMGKLGRIRIFQVIQGSIGFEFDGIDDIITVSSPISDPTSQQLAILQGSTSGQLTSPHTLVHQDLQQGDITFSTMIGHHDDDGKADIMAIGHTPDDLAARVFHVWVLPGSTGDGSINTNEAAFTTIPTSNFRVGCSLWALGDLDGDGRHEVIGIDRTLLCVTQQGSPNLAIAKPDDGDTPFIIGFENSTSSLRGVEDMQLVDLDGDGKLDLLMHFAGLFDGTSTERKGNGVAVAWNTNGTISLAGMTEVTIPNTLIHGVTWARQSDSLIPSLVVSTSNRLQVLELGSDGRTYGEPKALQFPSGNGRVRSADLDGDGLTDLAYSSGPDLRVLRAVPDAPLGSKPPPTDTE